MLAVGNHWKTACPGAVVGALVLHNVANPVQHPALEQRKLDLVRQLKERYNGLDKTGLKNLPVLQAYRAYYTQYKKTYHVQLQLESVLFKDRPVPSVASLVEAMFIVELDTLLLTAGHDLDSIQGDLTLDAGRGDEVYTLLNGQIETVKPGDMYIRDAGGVISSIIHGPDQRTRITPATRNALFTVYAPQGIDEKAVQAHLKEIEATVRLFSPYAVQIGLETILGE